MKENYMDIKKNESEEVGVMEAPVAKTETEVEEVSVENKLTDDKLKQEKQLIDEEKKQQAKIELKKKLVTLLKEEFEKTRKEKSIWQQIKNGLGVGTGLSRDYWQEFFTRGVGQISNFNFETSVDEFKKMLDEAKKDNHQGMFGVKGGKLVYSPGKNIDVEGIVQ